MKKDNMLNMTTESIRIREVCVDDKFMWVNDEVIEGVYVIDKNTFKVSCIINSFQLNRYGKFEMREIFQWNNKVIIVPGVLNMNWIIYDKVKKKLLYKRVTEFRWEISGLHLISGIAYLLPSNSINPIVVIDVKSLTVVRVIEEWAKNIKKNSNNFTEVWTLAGVKENSNIFFNLYNTKYIVKINKMNITQYFIEDIPFGIVSVGVSNNQFWILPQNGNSIYIADEKGKIKESIKLIFDKKHISASLFSRIVATEKYIFLLPVSGKNILVYDIEKKYFKIIYVKNSNLDNKYLLQCNKVSYWTTCIDRDKIYFMPLMNKFLKVDLNDLTWEQKDIFLPSLISGIKLEYWFNWNRCFTEGTEVEGLLKIFFGIVDKCNKYEESSVKKGEYIWRKLYDKL